MFKKIRVLPVLFFASLALTVSMLAWIYIDGTVLESSDPNIGAGLLMLLGGVLTLVFAVAWAVYALVTRKRVQ